MMTRQAWTTCALFAALLGAPALAVDDKNGVAPEAISRPSGPGSLEGLGDSFQPALNTGMAQYTLPIALPDGIAGFTPALALSYDAGRGFGVTGMGWSIGPGCIRRQTDEGLPRYGEAPDGEDIPDRFLGMEGEELVPLQGGHYLAKVEKLFIRYARVGQHWQAHTKSGVLLEFGLTPSARVTSPDGTKTFAWFLQRQTDTHGNTIEYAYEPGDAGDGQVYLSEIRYGPGPSPWTHAYGVHMTYEDRPDPFDDYRSGFMVRTTKRLAHVDVLYDEQLIRRYMLGYGADAERSFLTTVTPIGADGVTALPATTFGYEVFTMPDPGTPVSAAGHILGSVGEPPQVCDDPNVELVDLNRDGLPDLLSTGTGHTAYLNRGPRPGAEDTTHILWEGPIDLAAEEGHVSYFALASGLVHLADMTGDGIADLVVTDEGADYVEYFANTGQTGWAAGQLMSAETSTPPAPFGASGDSVLTADLGFNKRMDVIQSDAGAFFTWFNQGDGRYTGPIVTEAVRDGTQPLDFSDPGVALADMNGDRMLDIVKITTSSVIWWPSHGYGRFGTRVAVMLPDRTLDDSPGGNLHSAKIVDIDGDGLSDLVVERAQGSDLWLWRNLGDAGLATSRVVVDLPVGMGADVRWADINGNGTKDIIYADSSHPDSRLMAVDLARLLGGAAHYNLLTRIDNGYGRVTNISYGATTEFAVEALEAGHPWTINVPFPVAVVRQAATTISLDLDGYADEGPDGDLYLTDYVYRDGYFDPIEHQFRGFAFVKQINRGDERFGGDAAPTLVTRYGFHTGAPDGVDNDGDGDTDEEGDLWIGREEEPLKGVRLWQETTSLPDDPLQDGVYAAATVVFERLVGAWEIRNLATNTGGTLFDTLGAGYATNDAYSRQVRLAVQTAQHRFLIERGSGTAKELETQFDVDALGNPIHEWQFGDVTNPNDNLYTGIEYATNEPAWIMDRVSRRYVTDGGEGGAFVSETRHYYDGEPFAGLPLGVLGSSGTLHRSESLISKDPVPALTERTLAVGDPRTPSGTINIMRRQVDAYGNTIVGRDANGHYRFFEYDDALHKFTTQETIVVGGSSDDLELSATYDYRFGAMLTLTDPGGQVSQFVYDDFGRMTEECLPGDVAPFPTRTFDYDLGAPVSAITTTAHDNISGMPDISSTSFFDGLGRKLGTYGAGGGVMSEVTRYNTRGWPWKAYQPYFGGDGTWSLPPESVPAITQAHDATGRTIETVSAPDDDGVTARSTSEYLPLLERQFDGEDNNATGPHAGTPKTLVYDGLGRLVEVHEIENRSQVDPGLFVTTYRYALPDLIAEIQDANANIKYMRYDGLGRRIFMDDVDRGHLVYTYDAMGNLTSRVDAMGQEIVHTYDGANRLLSEDYLDDAHPLSRHRTPDIAYHYDAPHAEHPQLGNVIGRLAWVEDLTGAQMHGYDPRGHLETVVKRIEQPTGATTDYTTRTPANNRGQVYQTVYPGGDEITRAYDARGLLQTIPGFVSLMTHMPSGQRDTCVLANAATTTYTYDPRQRLTDLVTVSAAGTLQDLSYEYDQVANIVGITDNRLTSPVDPRSQTAAYSVDDLYRLTSASNPGWGTIEYDYDRLGNMATKTSPDISDDEVNVGAMVSGGPGGTSGRIGRQFGDPPGPHALTATDNGQVQRSFEYDANGNLTSSNGATYVYDFADRLGQVAGGEADVRYLYDYTGRRIIKRVDGVQTSYVHRGFEIRDGKTIRYILADGARVARVDGPLPTPENTAQNVDLVAGWNFVSFQVDPGVTDPAAILASIDGLYAAVFGHDGSDYTYYFPGGAGNTLTTMHPNRAYWIQMVVAGQWRIEGRVSETGVSVPADTPVMIAFPGLSGLTVEAWRQQYPQIRSVWGYASSQTEWANFTADEPAYVNTLTTTAAGAGYWIVSDEAILLTVPAAGDVQYYHLDHLGSTSVVSDVTGAVVAEFYAYPYGSTRHEYHAGQPYDPYYRFTGKEQDAETGLHYFETRYHDSLIGRFHAVDPLRATTFALAFPAKLNLYAYAENRPLRLTDPTGLDPLDSASPFGFLEDALGSLNDATSALPGKAQDAIDSAQEMFAGPLEQARDVIEMVERGVGDVLGAYRKATAFARRIADLTEASKMPNKTPAVVGMARSAYDLLTGLEDRSVEGTVSRAGGLIVAVVDIATSEDGLEGLGLGNTALGSVIDTLESAYENIMEPPEGDALDTAMAVSETAAGAAGAARSVIDRISNLDSAEGVITLVVEAAAVALDYFLSDSDDEE
ncbi:MAG: SpvB/TcaC N-terminal domain-containing protein [Phycisphaerae bacterium]